MDLTTLERAADAVREPLAARHAVVAVGAGTHAGVGNPVAGDVERVRAPSGIVAHEPADLTVRVRAGTPVGALASALADVGQEVPLDPRDASATVGGVLASGLSGMRRLRVGPVRDTVLEVRAVDGHGTLFTAGGPTVKNVTGFDVVRLLVGSLGTLAVMLEVVLRCRPLPRASADFRVDAVRDPTDLRAALFRPSTIAWDGTTAWVRLEGDDSDVEREAARAGLGSPRDRGAELPDGAHRGRISVEPRRVGALAKRLDAIDGVRWLAEVGVGTVHVASDSAAALLAARDAAHDEDGWLLREAGGDGCDGFGAALPNGALTRRVRDAFDPRGLLAPGRLPW